MIKKEIKILTEGESSTERVFEYTKKLCIEHLQEFRLTVKGESEEGKETILEHKQKNEGYKSITTT